MSAEKTITVSAVVFINDDLEVLTVRKRGTEGFMLPGGKPEAGESLERAAQREVAEELGISLSADQLYPLGIFERSALNEVGMTVRAHVYLSTAQGIGWSMIHPRAEIAQIRWVHPVRGNLEKQAPLNLEAVFPELVRVLPDYRGIDALAVFCGSRTGVSPRYAAVARQLGGALADHGLALVYGGGRAGLMGEVAAAALAGGGEVFGIIPGFLHDAEDAHFEITHLETVQTMHERKARMGELADAFVALPGGPGTLEELFEVWSWNYLGLHAKPVALLNVEGFWNPLLAMIESMVASGFVHESYLHSLLVADSVDDLLRQLGVAF